MRVAIRDAIAEEMRKDKKIFIIGEEVGEYQGAYKVTQGLLEDLVKKELLILQFRTRFCRFGNRQCI